MVERHFPPPPALRFPAWQREYEAASREMETKRLSQCIEVAEVAVLVRREAIRIGAEYRAEREAIEDALTHLDFLKRNRLRFHRYEDLRAAPNGPTWLSRVAG